MMPSFELVNKGIAAHRVGNLSEAEALYKQVLGADPEQFEALHFLGLIAAQRGELVEADRLVSRSLAINPATADGHSNHARILRALNRPQDALNSADKALAINGQYVAALVHRCNALRDLGRHEDALSSIEKALALNPSYAVALAARGDVLGELGRLAEAVASYDRAIAVRHDYAEAHNNRGLALDALERFDEALACFDRATGIRPDYAEAFYNRGVTCHAQARFHEALAGFDRALAIKPDFAEAAYNRGLTRLLIGQFAQGWRDYEHRYDAKDSTSPRPPIVAPTWNQEGLHEKSIIVFWEQGHGDIMQTARYLHALKGLGARVTFVVPRNLLRLLRPFAGQVELTAALDGGRAFDFQCPLMSLPLKFETDLGSIPNAVPYLCAEPELVARWQERIGRSGFRIGICWQGNPNVKIDKGRSVPLAQFVPLARLPGVRLISLQKHHGLDQLERLPADVMVETLGDDFDTGPDAFVDTAAVMMSLDLVITSDSALAHLAGALARPTWLVLKHVPDWRWLLDGNDSPWYPSMRLFRQHERGDWGPVFSQIEEEVCALVAAQQ